MSFYLVEVCYNARQDNKIQYSIIQYNKYSTVQYNTLHYNKTAHRIKHITQNNIKHSRQTSTRKITQKIRNTYSFKALQRVESKVDEPILKTTRNCKQRANHTTVLNFTHQPQTYTSIYTTSLIYTSHSTLPLFPSINCI
jgi:hypothetical protein